MISNIRRRYQYLKLWYQGCLGYFWTIIRHRFCRVFAKQFSEPLGLNKEEVSNSWINRVLGTTYLDNFVTGAEVLTGSLRGGLFSNIYKISLCWRNKDDDSYPTSVIMKNTNMTLDSYLNCLFFGSSREALFYIHFGNKFSFLPKIYYSEGSMSNGRSTIIMEDLSGYAVPASQLLGNQCFGKVQLPSEYEQFQPLDILNEIFLNFAEMSVSFFRDKKLLKLDWLKGAKWIQGKDRASWEISVKSLKSKWAFVKESIKSKQTKVQWSEKTINAIDTTINNSDWETMTTHWNINSPDIPFTLCHGDFHAANILWKAKPTDNRIVYIDWSEVGVLCPFSDIAQFLISNATVELRRNNEVQLLKNYYNYLIENGVDSSIFTWDKCWNSYEFGGVDRWIQILIFLATFSLKNPTMLPDFAMEFFYQQTSSFIEDHFDNIKVPHLRSGYVCYE